MPRGLRHGEERSTLDGSIDFDRTQIFESDLRGVAGAGRIAFEPAAESVETARR